MIPANHKVNLEKQLATAIGIDNIFQSADFQLYLYPALLKLSEVQVIDPTDFKSREDFGRACDIAMTKATVHKDLLKFLNSQKNTMERLRKQINAPEKNWEQ